MNKAALAQFPMTWLTCVALVLFFGVFVAAIIRVLKKSNREHFRYMESLPLEQEGAVHE